MNWDQAKGNWKQVKGKIKEKWGKLTDDELDQIEGQRDQLIGKIQKQYGITKEEAERQGRDDSRPDCLARFLASPRPDQSPRHEQRDVAEDVAA